MSERRTSEAVSATFEVKQWDEVPFDEGVGLSKVTRATVTKEYSDGVVGTSTTEWLMAYAPDTSATFVGLERIRGTIAGRHGSLVVQHVGTFTDGAATATLTVVSGTNELRSVSGSGDFRADPSGSIRLSLRFA